MHCVCPYFNKDNVGQSLELLRKLIYDIFDFCDSKGIITIALPPMGSGNCGYPTDVCSQAFFNGIMDYLEDKNLKTPMKKITICILEEDKYEKFLEEWEKRSKEKYPGKYSANIFSLYFC